MSKNVTIVFSVVVGILVVACGVLGFMSSSLNGKINTLNDDTQAFMTGTTDKFSTMYSSITSLDSNLAGFKTDTAGKFNSAQSSISGLDSSLNLLKTDTNTFKTDTAGKFTAAQNTITGLGSDLSAFKTDTAGKFSTAQDDITGLNTKLTSFKTDTASQFTTVQSSITGINSSVAGLNTDLTSLTTQYSESTMNVRQVYDDVIGSVCQIIGDLGSGSGFIYSAQGYIVTCWHVVDGQAYLDVILHDGTVTTATLVGSDQASDVAVIRINGISNLKPLTLADSSALVPGEPVIAVGNPLGIFETVVYGVISRTRGFEPVGDVGLVGNLIQYDAATNPGNSGGPMFNKDGQVIGIAESGSTIYQNINFAVSSNKVKRVADAIISYGSFTNVKLPGTYWVYDLMPEDAIRLGLDSTFGMIFDRAQGVGQIQTNDVVVAVNGTTVKDMADFFSYIAEFKSVGDTIVLTVIRNGTSMNLNVTLVAGWIDINSIG